MELEMQRFSVLLLDPLMTDHQFTEEVLFFRDFLIDSVIVLPANVIRSKQLVRGTTIKIGSFVDFPLGNGTFAKKAFETGQLYKEGAAIVFTALPTYHFENKKNYEYPLLEQLSFGQDRPGVFINTKKLTVEEKNQLAPALIDWNNYSFMIGNELSVQQAIYDLNVFFTAKGKQVDVQVNVKAPSLIELELLFRSGASRIGIDNGRDILPLVSRKK